LDFIDFGAGEMENEFPKFAKLNVEVRGLSINALEKSTSRRGFQVLFEASSPVFV